MPSGMMFAEIRKTLDHCIEPKTGYKLIMWVDETGSDISDSKYISENMQCIPVCLKLVDEEIDNIRYAIDEDTNQAMMISHGSSFSYDETIPETITVDQKQYTVTALGPNAYEQFGDSIKHITIPNTVTWVGGHCFNGCLGLESIILSENIKVLPEFCFTACIKLKKIENIQKLTVQRLG
ncbi:MAG: leucine-rich repeat domain-containing protein [Mycoplasmoidaceae bacterium]|nr:leucine-rich repeat domain-containing protein [Mycoplasmoidaceae bacterium]